ncbi:hypothetical protein ES703_58027 [subsurface metagenome]
MGKKGSNKWGRLLADENVDRWFRRTARGSRLTAEVRLRRLGRACELMGLEPWDIIDMAREDLSGFTDRIDDLVDVMEGMNFSPCYVAGILKSVKSWLRHNDLNLTRRIIISNAGRTPTIEDEQIPSKEELSRIFRVSPPRVRVAEAFIALADLRPMVLGDHRGQDGLRLRDLPELRIEGGKVTFEAIPTIVKVRRNLSKARNPYFSFLPEEGCTYLAEYLESRIREGEELTPDSPVIGHKMRGRAVNPFIRTVKLGDMIRKSMRKAGVVKRPYVLRCYAETQLIIAESKGKIGHPFVLFHAGHTGDISSRYSVNKGRLPPDMVEDMRKAYRACEPFLSTVVQPLEQSLIVKEAKLEALKSIAENVFGIDIIEIKIAKKRESGEEMGVDEEISFLEIEMKKRREGEDDPQIIVDEGDLENHLSHGWEFVSVLPSNRILIRRDL